MKTSGLLSISAVNAPLQQGLDLRPFQRVTAQVLSVTGTTALLTIEGYPVVAQLASADQAATLLPHQTAQFIVTQRTSEKVILKVISDDRPHTSQARAVLPRPELAVRLLTQQDIPVTTNHLMIARAMLRKHLPVNPLLLNELSETLSAFGPWGSKEADLSVALKAAGLPVNSQSLALASRQAAQTGDSIARLIAKLTDMAGQDLPDEILKDLRATLQLLDGLVLKADSESSQLAKQLKTAVEILGRSLENILLEQIQNPGASSENTLLALVQFRQLFEKNRTGGLADGIDDFLKDLQRNQFLNAEPDPIPGQGEWSEVEFAIRSPRPGTDGRPSSARLRIAREPGSASRQINPAYTCLILQVELEEGQTIEVDLSVVGKQIRTTLTAPGALWCQVAREELPGLEQALQSLGFTLNDMQIDSGNPRPFDRLAIPEYMTPLSVDIEA